jgi:uncharacterized membrane protein (DUF485 family)
VPMEPLMMTEFLPPVTSFSVGLPPSKFETYVRQADEFGLPLTMVHPPMFVTYVQYLVLVGFSPGLLKQILALV